MTAIMTGEEKAGLLLLSLNPQVADAVLNRLGPAAKTRLAGQMQRLAASPNRNDLMQQVLGEAERVLRKLTMRLAGDDDEGGTDKALAPGAMTNRVVGDDVPATGLRIARVGPNAAEDEDNANDPLAALNRATPERLLQALDNEN